MAADHECYFESMGLSHDRGMQMIRIVRDVVESMSNPIDISVAHIAIMDKFWTEREKQVASLILGDLVGQVKYRTHMEKEALRLGGLISGIIRKVIDIPPDADADNFSLN